MKQKKNVAKQKVGFLPKQIQAEADPRSRLRSRFSASQSASRAKQIESASIFCFAREADFAQCASREAENRRSRLLVLLGRVLSKHLTAPLFLIDVLPEHLERIIGVLTSLAIEIEGCHSRVLAFIHP